MVMATPRTVIMIETVSHNRSTFHQPNRLQIEHLDIMDQGIVWFEGLCQQLARDPKAVSDQYENFKTSEQVLQNCRLILQANQASPLAKFYALSAAQYALLMRWESTAPPVIGEWIVYLEELILVIAQQWKQLPTFLTRKVLLLYVGLLKRGWLSFDHAQRMKLVQLLVYLQEKNSVSECMAGANLMFCVLEEFRTLNYYDYNYMLKTFNQVKLHFEKQFLLQVFELAFQTLHKQTHTLNFYSEQNTDLLKYIILLVKAINAIIVWEYGEQKNIKVSAQGDENEHNGVSTYTPIATFYPDLFSPHFLLLFYNIYTYLRTSQSQANDLSDEGSELLQETRQVVLNMALVEMDVANGQNKAQFIQSILTPIQAIVQPHIERHTLQLLTFESADYDSEHNVRFEELNFFISVLKHLLFSQSLLTLTALPSPGIAPAVYVLNSISYCINSEVSTLVNDMLLLYGRSDYSHINQQHIIQDNWRGELLTSVLEVWVSMMDDYQLLTSSRLDNGLNSLYEYLFNFSAEFFPTACRNIVIVFVNTCLQNSTAASSEESENIFEEQAEDLLRNIAAIGRLNVCNSLKHLGNFMSDILQQFSGSKVINQDIYCLECLRLSLQLLTYILIDTQDSESPIVNAMVLDTLHNQSEGMTILFTIFQEVLVVLQVQVQFISTHKDKVSPAILEAVYLLFCDVLRRYIDPDVSVYSAESRQKYPLLSTALQDERWSALLDALVATFVPIIQHFPLELKLIQAACRFLSELCHVKNPNRILHLQQQVPLLQQFHLLYTLPINGTAGGSSVFCLSCESACVITETVLSICIQLLNYTQFEQIIRCIFDSLQVFDVSRASDSSLSTLRCMSIYLLQAMCKVKYEHSNFDSVIFPIYKQFLSMLFQPVQGNKLLIVLLMESYEDVLDSLVHLTHSFVQHLLSHSNEEVSQMMYNLIIHIFAHYSSKLSKFREDEIVDKISLLLDILHDLSLKEFIMIELYSNRNQQPAMQDGYVGRFISHTNNYFGAQQNNNNALPIIILYNFTLLYPHLTVKLLYTYERVGDKFTSLLLYVFSSFISYVLPQYIASLSLQQYQELVYVVLACTVHTSSNIARQSLQVLQLLASYQIELLHSPKYQHVATRVLASEYMSMYHEILRYQLKTLLCPHHLTLQYMQSLDKDICQNLKADLVSDRYDAFANAFFCYILLNSSQILQQDVVTILTQDMQIHAHHSLYPQYLQLFGKLVTDRDVKVEGGSGEMICTYIQKKNRQLFVTNFREFIVQIKALNAAHQ
ncbi:hypothetical protein EON65_20960 [archaeon]|nr:MAG: hypothetical protein EON65_20960 [archaeon]